jgi:iron complex outermembrane recepter protein
LYLIWQIEFLFPTMKYYHLIILFFCCSFRVIAQGNFRAQLPPLAKDSARVIVRIVDATDEKVGIEFATAVLMKAKDSTIFKATNTNGFGGAMFNNVPFGNYYVKVMQVGFVPNFSQSFTLSEANKELRLPKVLLTKDSKVLKTVNIVGEKSDYQNGLDKKVYNVDKNITNAGGTATDLLQNIPSVNVDMDGKVSLRGSEQIRIMIDGKLSGITATNPQAALQQMPASMIEQIEIITNPGAKYDAEGMGGIINIITKKGNNIGWSLNGQLSAGTNDKYGAGIGGNYRNDKINFSGNYNFRSENRFSRAFSKQIALDTNALNFESKLSGLNKSMVNNIRLSNDFYLDKYNTITIGGGYNTRSQSGQDRSDFDQSSANGRFDSLYYVSNKTIEGNKTYDGNFEYRYYDAEAKQTFSINMNQSNIERENETKSYSQQSDERNNYFRKNNVIGNVYLTTLQMDYAQPIGKGKLDAGLKFTQRFSKANQGGNKLDFISNTFSVDPSLINDYDYNEQVPAAYTQYSMSIGKWDMQAGLRYEHTLVNINNRTYDSVVNNNYGKLFPSGFLKYKIKQGRDIQLSYTRRINRPGIEALNPIVDNSNPLNLRIGNPYLKPELINSLDLSYSTFVKIFSFTSSVYYRKSTNVQSFFRTVDPVNPQIAITQFKNFATSDNIGTELTLRTAIGKQGNVMLNVNGFYNKINASNIEGALQSDGYNWNSRLVGNYKFKTNTNIQLSAFYMSPVIRPQGSFQGMNGVDLGLRQEFLKGKINVSLNVTDIFDIREFKITNKTNQLDFVGTRKRESRIATLALQWKIGSIEDKDDKRKGKRGQSEQVPPADTGDAGF